MQCSGPAECEGHERVLFWNCNSEIPVRIAGIVACVHPKRSRLVGVHECVVNVITHVQSLVCFKQVQSPGVGVVPHGAGCSDPHGGCVDFVVKPRNIACLPGEGCKNAIWTATVSVCTIITFEGGGTAGLLFSPCCGQHLFQATQLQRWKCGLACR